MILHQRVPKAQGWVIVEVVTKCLNLMVITCVMNQSRASSIIIRCFGYCNKPNCDYGNESNHVVDGSETFEQFEMELHLLS